MPGSLELSWKALRIPRAPPPPVIWPLIFLPFFTQPLLPPSGVAWYFGGNTSKGSAVPLDVSELGTLSLATLFYFSFYGRAAYGRSRDRD